MQRVLAVMMLFVGVACSVEAQQTDDLLTDSVRWHDAGSRFESDRFRFGRSDATRTVEDPFVLSAPKYRTFQANEKAMQTMDLYDPTLNVSRLPISYGEYQVGGVIRQFGKGALIGSGSQVNMIGLGTSNAASIGYVHSFNKRLTGSLNLTTEKFSAPHLFNQSIGTAGDLRYKLNDRITLNAFGSYDYNLNMRMRMIHLGGSAELDLFDKFGVEAGAQTYYDNWNRRWQTMPIVRPYYKISDDCKIGFDVGPILYDMFRNATMNEHHGRGPVMVAPMRRPR